jgi:hypothetical protein
MTDAVEISPNDVRHYLIAKQLTKFTNVVQYMGLSTEWDDMFVPVLLTQGRFAPVKHTQRHRHPGGTRLITRKLTTVCV